MDVSGVFDLNWEVGLSKFPIGNFNWNAPLKLICAPHHKIQDECPVLPQLREL